jgi:L-lactate dehydrogenase
MKIGVIGSGSVGVGICNYLLTLGSIRELILYNRTLSRAQGEILDFQHTSSLTFSKNTKLVATNNFQDLQNADIIVITAGAQIREGQNRLDIAYENSIVGVEIAKELEKVAPNAVLIVVTNPCDIVTYFISSNTGFDKRKVISAGCVIDTARLMSIVSKKVGVDPKNVFGYIIGKCLTVLL